MGHRMAVLVWFKLDLKSRCTGGTWTMRSVREVRREVGREVGSTVR